jgi:hypothetical protein
MGGELGRLSDDGPGGGGWRLGLTAGSTGGSSDDYRVWVQPTRTALSSELARRGLKGEDRRLAQRSEWALGVGASIRFDPLRDYHEQLRVLHALVPDAVAFVDASAFRVRPGLWLREAAATAVPPPAESLWTIHAVHDRPDGDLLWMHTHGLDRCGVIDLEILEVPRAGKGPMADLLNAAAALFIDLGTPEPRDPLCLGEGIEIVWLPWEKASRRQRDPAHAGPRGVLFAPARRRGGGLGRVTQYASRLEADPVLYVSALQTERMAMLATDRFDRFSRLQARFGAREGWEFLVELWYEIDGAACDCEREHLWFRVQSIDGEEVDATLVNEPHLIERMRLGDRARHSLERLDDWSILCEHGRFGPDSVVLLERRVGETDA